MSSRGGRARPPATARLCRRHGGTWPRPRRGLRLSGRAGAASRHSPRRALAALPPEAFIAFVQNHDQIGNRPLGDRLATRLERGGSPARPSSCSAPTSRSLHGRGSADLDTPFPFFCDFPGELGEAVRQGRRDEFAAFFEPMPARSPAGPARRARPSERQARLGQAAQEPYRAATRRDFRALAACAGAMSGQLAASASSRDPRSCARATPWRSHGASRRGRRCYAGAQPVFDELKRGSAWRPASPTR